MIKSSQYAIAGIAQTRVGRITDMSHYGLQVTAAAMAMEDAGVTKADIDGVITHSHFLGSVRVHHQHLSERLGLDTEFGVSISSGGATSCLMVQMAAEAGFCTTVLCVHGDKMLTNPGNAPESEMQEYGLFGAAAQHAFGFTRHMHDYGTTHDQLGAIAVACRKHAQLNPDAQMRKPLSLEDYHNSPWVVSAATARYFLLSSVIALFTKALKLTCHT